MKPPRLRYLGHVDGLSIYLVSGAHVRNEIDIDFTQGGNEAIYPSYVPAGEIWIDDAMHALDQTATALHEIVERDLMLHHGLDYDHAHEEASAYERELRKQMIRRPPRAFDSTRVAEALREYARERELKLRVVAEHGASAGGGRVPQRKPAALEREIAVALRSRMAKRRP